MFLADTGLPQTWQSWGALGAVGFFAWFLVGKLLGSKDAHIKELQDQNEKKDQRIGRLESMLDRTLSAVENQNEIVRKVVDEGVK